MATQKLSAADVQAIVEQIETAAEQRGRQQMVDALRDRDRYETWYQAELAAARGDITHVRTGDRRQLARYLEALATQPTDTTET